jgi:hypothetical protein
VEAIMITSDSQRGRTLSPIQAFKKALKEHSLGWRENVPPRSTTRIPTGHQCSGYRISPHGPITKLLNAGLLTPKPLDFQKAHAARPFANRWL